MSDPKRFDHDKEIDDFAIELEDTFAPVSPNPEFIHRLRRRLTKPPEMTLEGSNHLQNLLLTFGIVTAGLLVVVTIAWVIYAFLMKLGFIRKS